MPALVLLGLMMLSQLGTNSGPTINSPLRICSHVVGNDPGLGVSVDDGESPHTETTFSAISPSAPQQLMGRCSAQVRISKPTDLQTYMYIQY